MQIKNEILKQLSPHLFWDIDLAKLDWIKHKILITERVIERGSFKNFLLLEQQYGRKELTEIIKQLSYLHPKDIALVITYFNILPKELKCYSKKPLTQNYLD